MVMGSRGRPSLSAEDGAVEGVRRNRWLPRVFSRTFVFGGVWWTLAGGDPSGWRVGLPAVVTAAALSLFLSLDSPPFRFSPRGLLRFVPFFCIQSLRGGLDVAWRALHPSLPIHPCLIRYPLSLRGTPAQVFMADVVSLLPGTLSADLEADHLTVHALDGRLPISDQLRAVESRVAALFGAAFEDR